jgi:hypothetical protein
VHDYSPSQSVREFIHSHLPQSKSGDSKDWGLRSSIKGRVKKNTSPTAGNFLTFQPARLSEASSCLPPHALGTLHSLSRLLGFSRSAVFSVFRDEASPI